MKNSSDVRAILLLSCPDRPGLVSAVSRFIADNRGNIVHADQHTDFEKRIFIQRVEWQLRGFAIPRERIAKTFEPIARRFRMDWRLHFPDQVPRVAVLATKQAHCLYDLLARWRMGELAADIAAVISNHDELQPVAASFGVPYYSAPVIDGKKAVQEKRVMDILRHERVDLVVLARYMQVLGPKFIAAYRSRIINIHHSFLPAFAGAKPYHQAHARGVKVIGATAHYATRDLDQGPIIAQDVIRVGHRDTVEDLVLKGRDLEKIVLARAVKAHLARKVLVYGNKTVVFD